MSPYSMVGHRRYASDALAESSARLAADAKRQFSQQQESDRRARRLMRIIVGVSFLDAASLMAAVHWI